MLVCCYNAFCWLIWNTETALHSWDKLDLVMMYYLLGLISFASLLLSLSHWTLPCNGSRFGIWEMRIRWGGKYFLFFHILEAFVKNYYHSLNIWNIKWSHLGMEFSLGEVFSTYLIPLIGKVMFLLSFSDWLSFGSWYFWGNLSISSKSSKLRP